MEKKKRVNRKELYSVPLTESQKKLVEENHKLILGYANWKGIDTSEYYGILAIGLCIAAKVYNPDKGAFSSIAYYCMDNEFGHYMTKSRTLKRNCGKADLSYNDLEEESGKEYANVLADKTFDTIWIECELKDVLERFVKTLKNQKYKDIFYLRCIGYSLDEIAIMYGYPDRRNVDYYLKEIRKKWREFNLKDSK